MTATATTFGSPQWRPFVAALLSAVFPGAGQWFAGRRGRAILYAIPFAATVGAGVWVVSRGRVELVSLLVQPAWITAFTAANVALAVLRLTAAIDAYREEGGRWFSMVSAGTAIVVLALMLPHVVVGMYASDLVGLLETVFVTDDAIGAASTDAARYRGAASASTVPVPAEERGSIVVLADGVLLNQPDGVQRTVTPAFGQLPQTALDMSDGLGRVTVLLAGGDAGPGRSGLRTDVMIVATLDTETNSAVLFSVSRELVGFPVPARWERLFHWREEVFWEAAVSWWEAGTSLATDPPPEEFEPEGIWPDRYNSVYPYTQGVVEAYYPGSPDPSMDALADTLELSLGIPIPFWILVDMQGFVDLVDAIGGVDVNALEPMHVTFSPEREDAEEIRIDIDPGRHHLDGRLALAYVRNRSDSNDLVRTRRQRCMLREVAASLDPLTVISNFGAISDAIRSNATTNIPLRLVPELVGVAGNLDRDRISTMAFEAGYYGPDRNYRGLHIVDVERVRAKVRSALGGLGEGEPATGADECA